MRARHPALIGLLLALLVARPAAAQRDTTLAAPADSAGGALSCPVNGIVTRSTAGDGAPGAASGTRSAAPAARAALDTTITLAITDRTWTRQNVDVGVAVGVSGTGATASAPWRACAGAAAHLGSVTAHLHNVNGTIRLHADPGALGAVRRPLADTSRSTPPAAPPRR